MANNPKLRVKIAKTSVIENTPVNAGNLLIDEETGIVYFDLEESRITLGTAESNIISVVDDQMQVLQDDLQTRYDEMLADLAVPEETP